MLDDTEILTKIDGGSEGQSRTVDGLRGDPGYSKENLLYIINRKSILRIGRETRNLYSVWWVRDTYGV